MWRRQTLYSFQCAYHAWLQHPQRYHIIWSIFQDQNLHRLIFEKSLTFCTVEYSSYKELLIDFFIRLMVRTTSIRAIIRMMMEGALRWLSYNGLLLQLLSDLIQSKDALVLVQDIENRLNLVKLHLLLIVDVIVHQRCPGQSGLLAQNAQ